MAELAMAEDRNSGGGHGGGGYHGDGGYHGGGHWGGGYYAPGPDIYVVPEPYVYAPAPCYGPGYYGPEYASRSITAVRLRHPASASFLDFDSATGSTPLRKIAVPDQARIVRRCTL